MTSMVEVGSSIDSWDTIEVRMSSTYSWVLGQVRTPPSTHNWDMARWLDWLL